MIVWKKTQYSQNGYAGKIRLFCLGWNATRDRDTATPENQWMLSCSLPSVKTQYGETESELKEKAQRILESLISELQKGLNDKH